MTPPAATCECGGASSVEETRETSGGRIRRRRKCVRCGAGWRTYETRHPVRSVLDEASDDADRMVAEMVRMTAEALARS